MIFVILCEVIGTVACGVILGTLSSMFMATRLLEEKVDRELAELREFLEVKKIPRKVRNKVRRYMEHLYRCKTGYDEQELLDRYACALRSWSRRPSIYARCVQAASGAVKGAAGPLVLETVDCGPAFPRAVGASAGEVVLRDEAVQGDEVRLYIPRRRSGARIFHHRRGHGGAVSLPSAARAACGRGYVWRRCAVRREKEAREKRLGNPGLRSRCHHQRRHLDAVSDLPRAQPSAAQRFVRPPPLFVLPFFCLCS